MEDVGMTDKQYVALAKSLQQLIKDAINEDDDNKKKQKLETVIDILQESIEA